MGSFFNYDSPLWSGLGKLADLVILNLLTILFCIPIVTIGASITAAHYVALKIRRGEGYVVKSFWKSFKQNLGQSTMIWFLLMIGIGICIVNYMFLSSVKSGSLQTICSSVLLMIVFVMILTSQWVFAVQSKFINTIGATIKISFFLSFKYLLRTVGMVLIGVVPIVLSILLPELFVLVFLLGISGPIYVSALLYDKKFQELEDAILERQAEEAKEGTN